MPLPNGPSDKGMHEQLRLNGDDGRTSLIVVEGDDADNDASGRVWGKPGARTDIIVYGSRKSCRAGAPACLKLDGCGREQVAQRSFIWQRGYIYPNAVG